MYELGGLAGGQRQGSWALGRLALDSGQARMFAFPEGTGWLTATKGKGLGEPSALSRLGTRVTGDSGKPLVEEKIFSAKMATC